jgi:type IV pilus assembly protein PilC
MAHYKFTAKDASGRTVSDTMEADSEMTIVTQLRRKGLVVLSVETVEKQSKAKKGKKKIKAQELVIFSRQLATMVDAGLPLIQALDTLRDQADSIGFRSVVGSLVSSIESGSSFSEALAIHPKVFSNLFVNMVRAGETSGTLSEILDRIASYMEDSANLKRKVKSAMIYPAVVTVLSIVITTVLLVKVIPVFKDIYDSFGQVLPLPTRMLLGFSDFLRSYLHFGIIGLGVGVFLFMKFIKTEEGALKFDRFKFRVPIFGDLFKKISVSRFSRTLSVLIRSGVPILSAMDIVARTAGNKVIEFAIDDAAEEIKQGENIAGPLGATAVFPPMVIKMIAVGEEAGKLDNMLEKVSDFYDSQVDAAVSGLTSLIEPLLIVFMGVVIGGIVICMFLPIFKLSQVVTM